MTKKYFTPEEINARLAETRDQKFRSKSDKRLDFEDRLSFLQKQSAKERSPAYYKNKDQSFRKTNKWKQKMADALNMPIEIKSPYGKWIRYSSKKEAGEKLNWKNMANAGKKMFNADGSIYTVTSGKSPFKGWQLRRIID